MNKIIVVIILVSSVVFSQQAQNILSLENNLSKDFIKKQELTKEISAPGKKNVMYGLLLSMVLPGMGELYAGDFNSGKYFTVAEGVLWGTYIGINTYAGWQKDRYMSYAVSNGGVNPEGKNADYYATISEYTNIYDYNNDMAKQRDFANIYDVNSKYWKWTPEDRKNYRSMWVSSEQSYNNLRFIMGGLILNRVISAINAVRLVSRYNKNLPQDTGWNVTGGVINSATLPPTYTIGFQTTF